MGVEQFEAERDALDAGGRVGHPVAQPLDVGGGQGAVAVVDVAEPALVTGEVGAGAREQVVAGGLVSVGGGEHLGLGAAGVLGRLLPYVGDLVVRPSRGGHAQGRGRSSSVARRTAVRAANAWAAWRSAVGRAARQSRVTAALSAANRLFRDASGALCAVRSVASTVADRTGSGS